MLMDISISENARDPARHGGFVRMAVSKKILLKHIKINSAKPNCSKKKKRDF